MDTDPASCEGCGFIWADVSPLAAPERIATALDRFGDVIEQSGEAALIRPTDVRWSIVEYAGHLRDALLSMRERIILASILDTPMGTPIFREERIALGFSRLDSPVDVSQELAVAGGLFIKTVMALPDEFEARPLFYSPINTAPTTIGWVIAQGVHECEHHLGDVHHNLEGLR